MKKSTDDGPENLSEHIGASILPHLCVDEMETARILHAVPAGVPQVVPLVGCVCMYFVYRLA